jgi:hypothetical protein
LLWDVQKALPATQCMGASNQCYCISLWWALRKPQEAVDRPFIT